MHNNHLKKKIIITSILKLSKLNQRFSWVLPLLLFLSIGADRGLLLALLLLLLFLLDCLNLPQI